MEFKLQGFSLPQFLALVANTTVAVDVGACILGEKKHHVAVFHSLMNCSFMNFL